MHEDKVRRADGVDRHVAARVRARRITLGLTQHDLASRIGVTYQQLHKYETARNRMTAGRLLEIARALNVAPSYFFEGLQEPEAPSTERHRRALELAKTAASLEEQHLALLNDITRALAAER
jgi:transcriptional regulator with XRE-family HTH domain